MVPAQSLRTARCVPYAYGARPQPGGALARRGSALAGVLDHIARNLARRITVDELAAVAGMTTLQLSRQFRREHATTPYAVVIAARLAHAQALLRAGSSIADAAIACGFADQSHFTRHFRRALGITPKTFVAERAS